MKRLNIKESKTLLNVLQCYKMIGDITLEVNSKGDLVLPVFPEVIIKRVLTELPRYPFRVKFAYMGIEQFLERFFELKSKRRRRPPLATNGYCILIWDDLILRGEVIPTVFIGEKYQNEIR